VEINTSIEIKSSKDKVFAALITPSQIIQWWQASSALVVARKDGLFAVRWGGNEDDPDYISAASITRFNPPQFIRLENFIYYVKGQPEENIEDLPAEFRIKEKSAGAVELEIYQAGFPSDQPDFMENCRKGWQDVLIALKKLLKN